MTYPAFIKVADRELSIVAQNPSVRNLMLFIPLVVFILLAFIYVEGALRKIPVAVFDEDHTELSRTLIDFINSSPSMKVTYYLSSEDEISTFFLNHEEHAIFRIPHGMQRDVISGKNTSIQTLTNSSNIIFGNILLREAYTIVGTMSAGITMEKLVATGLTQIQTLNLAAPIIITAKPLFNPIYNYLYYLLPGLMTVLLQMIVFFISARSINSEYNNGGFSELVKVSNNSSMNIIMGKTLVYFFLSMAIAMFIALVFIMFEIPFKDMELELLFLFSVFILSNIALGQMLSTTIDDEILTLDIAFFYNSPAFVFSGFTFPMFGMPFFDSLYAQFIPYTHFLYAFFKVYQIGTPFRFIMPEIMILLLFTFVGFVTAFVALRIRIKETTRVKIITAT
ncbi:MAG: ABC transporter permease [Bacteroidetes bacterium]|nr:ABC transporter permease [Bacteroidota bacterium]MBL6944555.1 ABC transporter permease [Bacteroidales bacterium]